MGFLLSVVCGLPFLFVYHIEPSTTVFGGLLSVGLWAAFAIALAMRQRIAGPLRGPEIAWIIFLLATLVSQCMAGGGLSGTLQSAAMIVAAALATHVGMQLQRPARVQLLQAVMWGLLVAGTLSALIALVQVFFNPDRDTFWLASSPLAGRAIGNMRQPNHLAALLCMSMLAWLSLRDEAASRLLRSPVLAACTLAILVVGLVLSASRMGLYILLPLLVLWGALDRSLNQTTRRLWVGVVVASVLLTTLAMYLLDSAGGHQDVIGRLGEGAGSPSRIALWRNALVLAQTYPWLGVGWGQFNFAWTLTPFDNRRGVIVDHCHNLFLQLIVELGWPLGTFISMLIVFAVCAAIRNVRRSSQHQVLWRGGLGIVLVVGIHSMFELPLWYAYFLLPASFVMGVLLGLEDVEGLLARHRAWTRWIVPATVPAVVGVVLFLGSLVACQNYLTVSQIFDREATSPFLQRIQTGQATLFYSEWGDYVAATNFRIGPAALHAAQRTAHHAIDGRLLISWAENLLADGEEDKANYLMDRLREFPNPDAKAYLSKCGIKGETSDTKSYPCAHAVRKYGIDDF